MSARTTTTVLFVTRGSVAALRSVAGRFQEAIVAPSAGDDLATLIDTAARLTPSLKGNVWVLTDELFSQTLSLPASAVRGLDGDVLGRALSFEAQALSGMPLAESAFAWRSLPLDGATRDFWLVQLLSRDRDLLADTVRAHGGRLLGILHPGALPVALADENDGDRAWTRLERWRDATITVDRPSDSAAVSSTDYPVRVRIGRAGERGLAVAMPGDDEHVGEQLIAVDAPDIGFVATQHDHHLDNPAELSRWLVAWLEQLTSPRGATGPVIRAARRVLSTGLRRALMSAALLATVAGCWLHHDAQLGQLASVNEAYESAREPQRALDRLLAETRQRKSQLAALRRELDAIDASRVFVERCTARPALELASIANACPRGVVVERVDIGFDRTTISGRCTAATLANAFAANLDHELSGRGYRLSAPLKRAASESGARQLYEFELELHAVAEVASAPRVRANRD